MCSILGGTTVQAIYKALGRDGLGWDTEGGRRFLHPGSVRHLMEHRGYEMPRQRIGFFNLKGGVGKTTLAVNLALRCSHYGARVLVCDLDAQANATRTLGYGASARERPIWLDLIKASHSIQEAIFNVYPGLDLIGSSMRNSRVDLELGVANRNLSTLFQQVFAPVCDEYDTIIFDCPPAISKSSAGLAFFADRIIAPANPDLYSVDGLGMTLDEIQRLGKEFQRKVAEFEVLWNRYDAREAKSHKYLHEVGTDPRFRGRVLPVSMSAATAAKNAAAGEESVFDDKKSPLRDDLDLLARYILGIAQWQETRLSREVA
jgi:chromosome partitioning protein